MDNDTTQIIGILGFIISMVTTFIGVINHKRIKSTCCGRNVSASIDIENTTPTS